MTPYFQDEHVTIYHGDCREVLPELPRAELVFADPPFGIGKAEWDASFPVWSLPLMLEAGKTIAITPGECNFQQCVTTLGAAYRGLMIGHNINGVTRGEIGFANFIPIVIAGEYSRYQGATAFDFVVTGTQPDHPSPKPLRFMKWIVKRLCPADGLVIDPFTGSGTTLSAAKDLGMHAIGIEIEEKYCEVAAKRMAQQVLEFV